jgi:hypothetical protein
LMVSLLVDVSLMKRIRPSKENCDNISVAFWRCSRICCKYISRCSDYIRLHTYCYHLWQEPKACFTQPGYARACYSFDMYIQFQRRLK